MNSNLLLFNLLLNSNEYIFAFVKHKRIQKGLLEKRP